MSLKIIDRGRSEQLNNGRLEFIHNLVESEMHKSQAPLHRDEVARVAELKQKFEQVRSQLTIANGAAGVVKDVDATIRKEKTEAFKAQSSLEIKKLLDLI